LRREVSPVSMTRRLAALEGRIRPAPGPEANEGAREELNRRLDRIRENLLANGDLREDAEGYLVHPDGTRLCGDLGELTEWLQDFRVRRLGGAVVRCAADE